MNMWLPELNWTHIAVCAGLTGQTAATGAVSLAAERPPLTPQPARTLAM